MEIKGKIGGGITGLLLTGNPIGLIAGFIGGHLLFDRPLKKLVIEDCDLLAVLLGLSTGYIKSNPSYNKRDLGTIYYVFDESFVLQKEAQKQTKQLLSFFYKHLKTSDISKLIEQYLSQISEANKFVMLDILFVIYHFQQGLTPPQWTYICKLAGWLDVKEDDLDHFKMKYSRQSLKYYQTLAVSPFNSFEEIQKRYIFLAKKYHPDTSEDPGGNNPIKVINEAWNHIKLIHKMESDLY